jgi:hypothetical protein
MQMFSENEINFGLWNCLGLLHSHGLDLGEDHHPPPYNIFWNSLCGLYND